MALGGRLGPDVEDVLDEIELQIAHGLGVRRDGEAEAAEVGVLTVGLHEFERQPRAAGKAGGLRQFKGRKGTWFRTALPNTPTQRVQKDQLRDAYLENFPAR